MVSFAEPFCLKCLRKSGLSFKVKRAICTPSFLVFLPDLALHFVMTSSLPGFQETFSVLGEGEGDDDSDVT